MQRIKRASGLSQAKSHQILSSLFLVSLTPPVRFFKFRPGQIRPLDKVNQGEAGQTLALVTFF